MADNILDTVNNYYTQKINEHGVSPRGVDWNSTESQFLRFQQLCKVTGTDTGFSLLDFGCGYGAMLDYITRQYGPVAYEGFDISEAMIDQAKKVHAGSANASWVTGLQDGKMYDYTIASGIFNVRMHIGDAEWQQYILSTLDTMNRHSAKGFSFNMLTSYSDKEYMRDYLYYADPAFFFDYCKKNFSKYVAVLHDYPLYEFTILVKKNI